jgi:probable rRNA maturation factor
MILELKKNKYISKRRVRRITQVIENEFNVKYKYIKIDLFTDIELVDFNKKVFGKDYLTDIISINNEESYQLVEGELLISIERVLENEERYNTYNELERIIIHGLLHLIGKEDKTEKEKDEMTENENMILRLLDVSRETKS